MSPPDPNRNVSDSVANLGIGVTVVLGVVVIVGVYLWWRWKSNQAMKDD
jgi:predicted transporter